MRSSLQDKIFRKPESNCFCIVDAMFRFNEREKVHLHVMASTSNNVFNVKNPISLELKSKLENITSKKLRHIWNKL
jgi:hypothetical protein